MDVEAVPARWQKNPLTFFSSPGTLASLACSKVALFCWSYEIHDVYPEEASILYEHWFITHKFSCVDVYKTSLPSSIILETDNCIRILGIALKNWIDDLYEIFGYEYSDNSIHDVISRCIDHIVVESNGIISYKKTARSLLLRDKMTSYEKYLIACKYCFESDVRRLWPSVSSNPVHSQKLCWIQGMHTLINYWIRRMDDEPSDELLLHKLLSSSNVYWPMIEYFWNRFNQQQESSVIPNISTLKTSGAIKYLLPVLSTNQLTTVLIRIPNKILKNLTDNEENYHYAVQVWDFMLSNDIITNEIFLDILVELCKITEGHDEDHYYVYEYKSYYADITYFTHATRRELLHLIWITATDNLKFFILNQHVLTLFLELLNLDSWILFQAYGFNMDFFLELLINSEFQLRSTLWRQYWHKFVVFAAASDLKIIMELCLPEDDIVEFKKQMVDYESLKLEFNLFVFEGRYLELENYLKLFSSSESEEKLVRRQIVDFNMSKMFESDFERLKISKDFETWKKFNDFVDGAFSSVFSANKRKEEYFRNNLKEIYSLLDNGLLNSVKKIANFLLSHNQEYLAEMKRVFLVRFRSNLVHGSFRFMSNFNSRNWQEFIKFCTRTDDDFVKFKNNLAVDHIFEAWLIALLEYGRENWSWSVASYDHLNPLSNFLRWYLDDGKAVKKFLSEKIAYHQHWNSIRNILEKEESRIVYGMLRWFFNGDNEQVKEFCKRSELKMVDISCYLN